MIIAQRPPSLLRHATVATVLSALALLAGPAAAQEQPYALAPAPAPKNLTLLGVPSATVAPHGLIFSSLSISSERVGPGNDADGSLAVGFGLGSAEEAVGLQTTAHFTSLSDSPGDSGYLAFSLSRQLNGGATPVYAGLTVNQVAAWGDSSNLDPSGSIALTFFPTLTGRDGTTWPLMFTIGGGSDIRNFETEPGIFVGAGIGLTPELGASVAWYGDHVTLGAAYRPRGIDNAYFAASLVDAFDQEDSQRVVVSFNLTLANAFGR